MIRNEKQLLESLFNKIKKEYAKPAPLTQAELAEIETYRDKDGLIDLTGVKCYNNLKRLIELVDRKNHLEEITLQDNNSIQSFVGDLVTELLPLVGVNKATLKVDTPAGKASVEIEQGQEPKITYDLLDTVDKPTLTYTVQKCDNGERTYTLAPKEEAVVPEVTTPEVTPVEVAPVEETPRELDFDTICAENECETCPYLSECTEDVVSKMAESGVYFTDFFGCDMKACPSAATPTPELVSTCDEFIAKAEANAPVSVLNDETVVQLVRVGGCYNPEFYNAVHYICENEHYSSCGVYTETDTTPEQVNTYVLLPNAFGKMYETEAEMYADKMRAGSSVVIIHPETFELTEITNPFDLWDYAMTEAQENALRCY